MGINNKQQIEAEERSFDASFGTAEAYGRAVKVMEGYGIAKAERELEIGRSEFYGALEDIRKAGGRYDELVWEDTVGRARETLKAHGDKFDGSMEVAVLQLALRVIANSDELLTYITGDHKKQVNAVSVERGVSAFNIGIEFLKNLEEKELYIYESNLFDNLAQVVYQAGRCGGSTPSQLSARMSAIARAAIDEVNSIRMSAQIADRDNSNSEATTRLGSEWESDGNSW